MLACLRGSRLEPSTDGQPGGASEKTAQQDGHPPHRLEQNFKSALLSFDSGAPWAGMRFKVSRGISDMEALQQRIWELERENATLVEALAGEKGR